ncbi:MAG: FecR domain-containing protein [Candidatus Didemnitutus sp.]|nr:FecR domain-containing protein [Candidatus Didemnitutus sp.]
MKTTYRTSIAALIVVFFAVPIALSQPQLGKKKGPMSKLYLAESVGESQITTDGRLYEAKQATAFDAPGTVLETKIDSHQAFVYSNGTGMYVDENTRVEVDRFVQEPFRPDRNTNTDIEPSISQSDVFVARGQVGICTGQMISGSTMNYGTPHGGVNIRGGKVAVQTNEKETTIYLLEGDVTVRGSGRDVGGTMLKPGEKATIRPGPPGRPPTVTIAPIPKEMMSSLDDKVAVACNAKKTVSFETIEQKSTFGPEGAPEVTGTPSPEPEIVARPTTPTNPPVTVTVSLDRLGSDE